jgi:hypothetical protein
MMLVGRLLQYLGLILLPLSVVMELTHGLGRSFYLADMLKMLVLGWSAFTLGRYLEGYAKQRELH